MKSDNRIWRILHVLIHMSQAQAPMTSQSIGEILNTNPVVVRRTMAGLRNKGYLHSVKGPGGGWGLNCTLAEISLLDVYQALDSPAVFAIEAAEDSHGCLIEKAVNHALNDVLEQARRLILEKFSTLTLADIEKDFQAFREVMPHPCTKL
jgi:Rrf2 family protein